MSLIQLTSANATVLNNSISEMFQTGKFSNITITVFDDATGEQIAQDTNGPIQNRIIVTISHTDSHINEEGNPTNGSITLDFNDGTSVVSVDNVNTYFCRVDGTVFVAKTFGNPQ